MDKEIGCYINRLAQSRVSDQILQCNRFGLDGNQITVALPQPEALKLIYPRSPH